jgi:hypothetical protein
MSTPRNPFADGGSHLSRNFKGHSFRFFRDGPDDRTPFYRAVKLAPDLWAGSQAFRDQCTTSGSFDVFTKDWPTVALPLLCVSSVLRPENGGGANKWKNNSTLTLCRAVLTSRPEDPASVAKCQIHLQKAAKEVTKSRGHQRNKFSEQDNNLEQGYCGIADMGTSFLHVLAPWHAVSIMSHPEFSIDALLASQRMFGLWDPVFITITVRLSRLASDF